MGRKLMLSFNLAGALAVLTYLACLASAPHAPRLVLSCERLRAPGSLVVANRGNQAVRLHLEGPAEARESLLLPGRATRVQVARPGTVRVNGQTVTVDP